MEACDTDPMNLDSLQKAYSTEAVDSGQQNLEPPRRRVSSQGRVAAAVVAGAILAGFAVLVSAANGWIDLTDWFGVCGFRQRHGLPCPGCYWTTAGMELVRGHLLRALVLQPAATVAYVTACVVAVFALRMALTGVYWRFLDVLKRPRALGYVLVAAGLVVLAGWAVTLARTWAQGFP